MLQGTWVCKYLFKLLFLFSLEKYPEVELLNHIVILFLIFLRTTILFIIVTEPIYIATNSAQEFPFLDILVNTLFLVFLITPVLTDKVISHCGFDLHFPDNYWYRAPVHVPVGSQYTLHFLYFFLVVLLFKIAPKQSTEVLFRALNSRRQDVSYRESTF